MPQERVLTDEMHAVLTRYARQLGLLKSNEFIDHIVERFMGVIRLSIYTQSTLNKGLSDEGDIGEKTAVMGG